MSNGKKRRFYDDQQRDENKKIKEERYSTLYKQFQPFPHTHYFINRSTDETTLKLLIQTASASDEFTIDTESINIPGKQNEPALIQLLMIHPYHASSVVIIECHHLIHKHHPHFKLIEKLFQVVLSSKKTNYIFGSKTELKPFIRFELFSLQQIESMTFINLQRNFKRYWQENHHHKPPNPENTTQPEECQCETCIGKKPTESWSLQDCLAYELKQHLPKLLSQSKFNIGLDPTLRRLNSEERNHRRTLVEYACNDVLSMECIIRSLKNKQFKFEIGEQTRTRSKPTKKPRISFDDSDDDDGEIYLSQLHPMVDRSVNQQQIEQQQIEQRTKKPLINRQPIEQLNKPSTQSTNRTIYFSNDKPTTDRTTSSNGIFSTGKISSANEPSSSNEHSHDQSLTSSNEISHEPIQHQSNEQPPTTHSTNRTISHSNEQRTTIHSTSRTVIISSEPLNNRTIPPSNEHTNGRISIPSNERSNSRISIPSNEHLTDRISISSNEHLNGRLPIPSNENFSSNGKSSSNGTPSSNGIFSSNEILSSNGQLIGQTLTVEQRKKIHNRSCTVKQRQRAYQKELIFRNIEKRFSITQIKKILKESDIDRSAVNKWTSRSNQTSLYIGVKDGTRLEEYKSRLQHGFKPEYYRYWRRNNPSDGKNCRNDRRDHHRQFRT